MEELIDVMVKLDVTEGASLLRFYHGIYVYMNRVREMERRRGGVCEGFVVSRER